MICENMENPNISEIMKMHQNKNPNIRAFYSNIPISYLDEFRKFNSVFGIYYKIRYRGPRSHRRGQRSPVSIQTTCLRQDARTFTAYAY